MTELLAVALELVMEINRVTPASGDPAEDRSP